MIYRKNRLLELVKNKSVLHLGYVHHFDYQIAIDNNTWLHKDLSNEASNIIRLDYLANEVKEIKDKYNYEGYFADVMKLEDVPFSKKFDVIICGELINHIENPGLMLNGLKRFMNKDTMLVLTTPNQYSLHRIIKIVSTK